MAEICVFSSSSEGLNGLFLDAAQTMGRLIGEGKHTLIYGGSTLGLMGEVARSTKRSGGRVIGVLPRMWAEKLGGLIEDEVIVAESMSDRKRKMMLISDAFIAIPGGIGTLDELTEVIAAKQVGEHNKAIAIVNAGGFYDDFLRQLEKNYTLGLAKEEHRAIYSVVANPNEAINHVLRYNPVTEFRKI